MFHLFPVKSETNRCPAAYAKSWNSSQKSSVWRGKIQTGAVSLFLLIFGTISGQENPTFRVLPAEFNADKENQMMRAWQRKKVHAALDARLAELETALKSTRGISAFQSKRRDFLEGVFGPAPEKTPLNAKVVATIDREGFRIENVIFESLPNYFVTANVYRPDGEGPFPGVLLPCGHSANGKAYSSYQKACILLAQNGFVVLCFDPVGQGERRQLIGPKPHPILRPRGEHNNLGVAPILLGRSLGSMMVHDGIRAIDHLSSRPDVDPNRIGCTGNSGGGNLTSYLMAFDKRIVAAAPGCFMTTHRRKNEKPGPGDAEQNLFSQIREGFDHPDFILTRAPKPTLILAATHDYVPIEGAWESFRQGKRVFTALGYPERIDLIEANEKHGFNKRFREGVVRFFARWLQGKNIEIFEPEEVPVLSDAELQVTPDGQVLWLPDARSIFDVFTEHEQKLAANRREISEGTVRQVTGIRPLEKLPEVKVESVSEKGHLPEKLIIRPEPGILLPALYWRSGDKEPILLAPGGGMNEMVPEAFRLHKTGHPVLIVEVRDTGETKTKNWRFYGADSYIGQMLGHSWLAMGTEDLIVSGRWLAGKHEGKKVLLHASGEAGPAGIHAAWLESELFHRIVAKDNLESWRELMTDREASRHIHQVVYGALRYYDLTDLQTPTH